ncbi:MAG: hypothetical protein KH147_00540 [Actinomyces graevenitzii]|nr:hypothetical protein [Actinomyces graevenitzii]
MRALDTVPPVNERCCASQKSTHFSMAEELFTRPGTWGNALPVAPSGGFAP